MLDYTLTNNGRRRRTTDNAWDMDLGGKETAKVLYKGRMIQSWIQVYEEGKLCFWKSSLELGVVNTNGQNKGRQIRFCVYIPFLNVIVVQQMIIRLKASTLVGE